MHYAELRSIWGEYNTSQPIAKIEEAKQALAAQGVKTSVLGTAFFKIPLPPETPEGRGVLDSQWALLDQAMERARILGTDKIRVFAFTYKNVSDKANEKDFARIVDLVREATRRAKARSFRLALENVGASYVSTAADSAKLLHAIQDSTLGLTWDPNNAAEMGEKPFPEGYNLLDPARIYHVHLRDYAHRPDGKVEWRAVGDGEFDNAGQIRALLKTGYKDNFTLETHWRSPKGKEFATRTSLTALLKVIEQV